MSEQVNKYSEQQALGIDLGTTNSLVAMVKNYRPTILNFTPSIVYYGQLQHIIIGEAAQQFAVTDPINTISSVKRWLGKSKQDFDNHISYYQLAATDNLAFVTRQGNKTPVMVSADLLRHVMGAANANLQRDQAPLTKAVITVPAYFNNQQRQETKSAAENAGIEVLRLINEPTAAAIAYGFDNLFQGKVIVYDLGGGTLDVSLLDYDHGVLEVVAISGDNQLGGDDFDRRLYCHILEKNGLHNLSPQDSSLLLNQAKRVKESLSLRPQVSFNVLLSNKQIINMTITQAEFTQISQNLISRAILPLKQVLKDSKTRIDQIDDIILVGGSTRMPVIIQMIKQMFAKQPLNSINPDEVVAMGAALQADKLVNPDKYHWQLLDKTAISYGIETINYLVEKIIPKNTTIPISRTQVFTNAVDNQEAISIHVVQGESEVVTECCSLARFILNGIQLLPARQAQIEVNFQIDANGILKVSAKDAASGAARVVDIKT